MKGQGFRFNIKAKYFHFVQDNWMLIQVLDRILVEIK